MPNDILAYYQAIKDGTEAAGDWLVRSYERIVSDLEAKVYRFDQKKANTALIFMERFCRHHEGPLGGETIRLELWQRALVSAIFGLVDDDGTRHFREVFVVIGRKNGKTLLASAIAAYMAFADGEQGARIYMAAPKLEQANLCFDSFVQTVKKEPVLSGISQKRRTDVYIESSNSTVKPLAFSAKKSDGLNVSLGICDEVASWQGDQGLKFWEVLKSSQGARRQPLLLGMTTAGYLNDGIYDELYRRSTRYLMGDSKEKRLLPFIYQIDDPRKWNDINELKKANPNLGVSVSVDYMLEEIAVAEGSLSKKAEFLVKYCNIKQNSSQAWLRSQDVEAASGAPLRLEDFRNCYAVGGIDLSRSTDLTACCAVIEKGGHLYVFAKFFLPAEKIEEATARDGLPYRIYAERGLLQPSGDNIIDYRDCTAWFTKLVKEYKVLPLQTGYDRYCAQYLTAEMQEMGFHMDDVFQGFNLTPVINEFDGLLRDGRIHIGDNDLLKAHMLNAAVKNEANTERKKLVKMSQNEHIDGMAALLDAMTVRQKWAAKIGPQLKNER